MLQSCVYCHLISRVIFLCTRPRRGLDDLKCATVRDRTENSRVLLCWHEKTRRASLRNKCWRGKWRGSAKDFPASPIWRGRSRVSRRRCCQTELSRRSVSRKRPRVSENIPSNLTRSRVLGYWPLSKHWSVLSTGHCSRPCQARLLKTRANLNALFLSVSGCFLMVHYSLLDIIIFIHLARVSYCFIQSDNT